MSHITIIGLGGGDLDQLSLRSYRTLTKHEGKVYTRTIDHPLIPELEKEGVAFQSFDTVYEKHDDFQSVYEEITSSLIQVAEEEPVLYTVPGHPMLAEQSVQLLLAAQQEGKVEIQISGGQSYLDDTFSALGIDPIEGFQFMDGTSFNRNAIEHRHHTIFCQVYDEMIASAVKLELMEDLSPDTSVYIVNAAGSSMEEIIEVPLHELDRSVKLSNLTSVYVPPVSEETLNHQFFRLRDTIATLRGPEGCPWDKEQTHESLRPYLIEEAYEFIDAVVNEDDENMIEELGDLLLQIMLHSQIGEDEGFFSIDDVILSITDKMIRRHPHVFGEVAVESSEDVVSNWDEIKRQEKEERMSALDGVEESSPQLLRSKELQKKAKKVGFDWDDPTPIWEKIEEELEEFRQSLQNESANAQELEFGDVLFALVNLARYYKINPELALRQTNAKFERRFREMEIMIQGTGQSLESMTLSELDAYWEKAKMKERNED
ncbi:hypothetical protein N781_08505 [Pontibacillus halophilus JSM 076056 = DSM 19796]|uniref:MazG family protein n=1 Tax=Pontibacillus halophilus JSM 076056 = DSM 19796 TaxID=1385510 RepID=A0A0A5GA87_9BACI|nr:nucleoside triphosphate pyrophosphohydrolase [Pontibacillus halophilus]KGX90076.1 hypothetical protein N781_08505 [Pontibacillus halophilus JSM 076056 = DSM 19796]